MLLSLASCISNRRASLSLVHITVWHPVVVLSCCFHQREVNCDSYQKHWNLLRLFLLWSWHERLHTLRLYRILCVNNLILYMQQNQNQIWLHFHFECSRRFWLIITCRDPTHSLLYYWRVKPTNHSGLIITHSVGVAEILLLHTFSDEKLLITTLNKECVTVCQTRTWP